MRLTATQRENLHKHGYSDERIDQLLTESNKLEREEREWNDGEDPYADDEQGDE